MTILFDATQPVNRIARTHRFGAGLLPHTRLDEIEYAQLRADREQAAVDFNEHVIERDAYARSASRRVQSARDLDAVFARMAERYEAARRVESGPIC